MVFVGAGESIAEALFLQCPRRQSSPGVLTAESPHNAQALRFFRLCRQNVRANTLLRCPGCLHLLERHTSYGKEMLRKRREERKQEARDGICVCESGGSDMCYDVHGLNPLPTLSHYLFFCLHLMPDHTLWLHYCLSFCYFFFSFL